MPGLRPDTQGAAGPTTGSKDGGNNNIDNDISPIGDKGQAKAWVTAELINAIKALEVNQRRERPQAEQAAAAFSKLQFDFPVVQLEELKALIAELRSGLGAKAGAPPFQLTAKFLENITDCAAHMNANPTAAVSHTAVVATDDAAPAAPKIDQSRANGVVSVSGISAASAANGHARNDPAAIYPPIADGAFHSASGASHSAIPVHLAADPMKVSAASPRLPADSAQLDTASTRLPTPVAGPNKVGRSSTRHESKSLSVAASIQVTPVADQAGSSPVREVYQELCCVVLLEWMAKLLTLPEEAAWQLLGSFHAQEDPTAGLNSHESVSENAPTTQGGSNVMHGREAEAGARTEETADSKGETQHRKEETQVSKAEGGEVEELGLEMSYNSVEAEDQDDDDTIYEDMFSGLGMSVPSAQPSSHAAQSAPRQVPSLNPWLEARPRMADCTAAPKRCEHVTDIVPYIRTSTVVRTNRPYSADSWPALKQKLILLASHARYSVMCEQDLWRRGSHLPESLMVLLRALGAHNRSGELQDVTSIYVRLLTERLLDAPSDMRLSGHMGEALGVAAAVEHASAAGQSSRPRPPTSPLLPPESTISLTMLSQLTSRVLSPQHRSLLWDEINTHFLSAVEGGLSIVERCGQSHPDAITSLSLLCNVVGFHVAQAPPVARANGLDCIGRGTLRCLCVLFGRHGADSAAEPLRLALLMCAASSAANRQWVAAVAGVRKALQADCFKVGGAAEAHGIAWELLLNNGHSRDAAALLQLAAGSGDEVVRALRVLHLLARCCAVSPSGRPLGSPTLQSQLQAVFNQLQAELIIAPGNQLVPPGSQQVQSTLDTVDLSQGDRVLASGGPVVTGDEGRIVDEERGLGDVSEVLGEGERWVDLTDDGGKSERHGAQDLAGKKARQMKPACLRLLKELLLEMNVTKKD